MWFANEWALPMIVLRRLWDADGCGLMIVVMDRGSEGCGPMAAMEVSFLFFFFFLFCYAWFFLGPIGLRSCDGAWWSTMEHRSERGSKESWSDLVDLVCGFFGCGLWSDLAMVCRFFSFFFLLWLVVIWSDCC